MFERMGVQFDDFEQLQSGQINVDIGESDEEVTVTADLPGYDREDIHVSIHEGQLTLRAERDHETEQEDEKYHRRERTHREVTRTIRVPADVEKDAASATYSNGVLTVTLPKVDVSDDGGYHIDVN